MADHTFNLILNIPEDCLPQVQTLMGWLLDEVGVVIANSKPDSRDRTGRGKR